MIAFSLTGPTTPISHLLCLGAHADDIEIGCGGTVLTLLDRREPISVTWVVFSAEGPRAEEAHRSAEQFANRAAKRQILVKDFRDGFLPYAGSRLKEAFEELKATVSPDMILTHYRNDLHQDHRLVSELTWNTFRDHLIFEYEIPKYDGDIGNPNVFVPLDEALCRQKIGTLLSCFGSQSNKRWFTEDLFRSLLRVRGMECNAASGYAEAFYAKKLVVA